MRGEQQGWCGVRHHPLPPLILRYQALYFRVAGGVQFGVTLGPLGSTLRTVGVLLRDKCGQFVRLLFVKSVFGLPEHHPNFSDWQRPGQRNTLP